MSNYTDWKRVSTGKIEKTQISFRAEIIFEANPLVGGRVGHPAKLSVRIKSKAAIGIGYSLNSNYVANSGNLKSCKDLLGSCHDVNEPIASRVGEDVNFFDVQSGLMLPHKATSLFCS